MLYFIDKNKLNLVKEENFKLEKEIQKLTENNLNSIFGLNLIKSEFALNGLRIDSLAYNEETKSFVIIEYKKDRNFSVIDQGYAYLSLMLNNKSDFILEYNENSKLPLRKNDIDWSQSRVIFIAPGFSKYQQQAINFKDLPIELWEIKKFQNSLIQYDKLRTNDSDESINKITDKPQLKKVNQEIKVYNENDLLNICNEDIKDLYYEFKNKVLEIDGNIEISPKKLYIAYKGTYNIIDIVPLRGALKISINMKQGSLKDPNNLTRNMYNIGHWGNGDYETIIKSSEEIIDIMPLVKQSYEKNK